MKKTTDICKSLENFCLKKLKCQVKCKKLKNSCEKSLSIGCNIGKVGKKQSVKPKTVKPKTVKPKTVKPNTSKKESIKSATKKVVEEVKKESIKSATEKVVEEIKKESIKSATKKTDEVMEGDVKNMITLFEELKTPREIKKETIKIQQDINDIATKNEIAKKEEKYVQKVFKNLNIEYKSCDSLDIYKENLRQKCIKFLGYQSDTKKQEGCIATRFRWLMEAHPELESSLNTLGCKIPRIKKH